MGLIPENWKTGEYSHFAESINRSVNQTDKEKFDKYVALEDMPRKRLFINKFSSVEDVTSSMIEFKENEILFGSMRPYFHKICIAPLMALRELLLLLLNLKKIFFINTF